MANISDPTRRFNYPAFIVILAIAIFCGCDELDQIINENDEDPESLFATLNSSELEEKLETENIYADYYRMDEKDRFKFHFGGQNVEGEIVPDSLVIEDKNLEDTFYFPQYDGVWDAVYDPGSNAIFLSMRVFLGHSHAYDLEDQEEFNNKAQNFADYLGMNVDELMEHQWEANNMCGGCPSFTLIDKINLDDWSVEESKILGGEELQIKDGSLLATQYTSDYPNICYCWIPVIYPDQECTNLNIKVNKINPETLKISEEYFVKQIGEVHDFKSDFEFLNDRDLFNKITEGF